MKNHCRDMMEKIKVPNSLKDRVLNAAYAAQSPVSDNARRRPRHYNIFRVAVCAARITSYNVCYTKLLRGGFEMTLAGFVGAMTELGVGRLVLTDGDRGAYVGTRADILFCPAVPCETVGTAGAGDAFASTFTAGLGLGWSVEDALRAATLNAASVIGYVDTQTGLLACDDLRARMADTRMDLRRWELAAAAQ